ncbi:unnamed protein product [Adineta steineri]|uniref:Uncharacterized protein n=1 Tax=Adineta steineri TaxID=433720 RepID=A0A814HD01_9BILA|nr:unnamed protein product [Adineta steineri]CAF1566815.1 unnamed protein product [Adineta steineri]CAF1567133.1 unnamed protein product [Adineta steineri]
MMGITSKFDRQTSDILPIYVNSDPTSGTNNVRLRHMKPNISKETTSLPAHFILSTDDYHPNVEGNDFNRTSRYKHNKTQIIFLIFTFLVYFLYTIRAYISEKIQTTSGSDLHSFPTEFWYIIKPKSIIRNYTLNLRANLIIENRLIHTAEICQTLWLVYILSYIVRRTHLGYLYRNPNVFSTCTCLLLISALSFQIISQATLSTEVSCACLFISFILLIITCRLITVKVLKHEEKIKSTEVKIIRCFILNSLFLYTTSIGYLTICNSIECISLHLFSNLTSITTIGLLIALSLLIIYFLLDYFIYKNEFQLILSPYLFTAIAFLCPPLHELLSNESLIIENNLNFYLHWALFSTTILMILIHICRKISIKYRAMKNKTNKKSLIPQATLPTMTFEHFS